MLVFSDFFEYVFRLSINWTIAL